MFFDCQCNNAESYAAMENMAHFYETESNYECPCTATELCEMLKAAHGDQIMPRTQKIEERREYVSNVRRITSVLRCIKMLNVTSGLC
jgi:hypothetical protein